MSSFGTRSYGRYHLLLLFWGFCCALQGVAAVTLQDNGGKHLFLRRGLEKTWSEMTRQERKSLSKEEKDQLRAEEAAAEAAGTALEEQEQEEEEEVVVEEEEVESNIGVVEPQPEETDNPVDTKRWSEMTRQERKSLSREEKDRLRAEEAAAAGVAVEKQENIVRESVGVDEEVEEEEQVVEAPVVNDLVNEENLVEEEILKEDPVEEEITEEEEVPANHEPEQEQPLEEQVPVIEESSEQEAEQEEPAEEDPVEEDLVEVQTIVDEQESNELKDLDEEGVQENPVVEDRIEQDPVVDQGGVEEQPFVEVTEEETLVDVVAQGVNELQDQDLEVSRLKNEHDDDMLLQDDDNETYSDDGIQTVEDEEFADFYNLDIRSVTLPTLNTTALTLSACEKLDLALLFVTSLNFEEHFLTLLNHTDNNYLVQNSHESEEKFFRQVHFLQVILTPLSLILLFFGSKIFLQVCMICSSLVGLLTVFDLFDSVISYSLDCPTKLVLSFVTAIVCAALAKLFFQFGLFCFGSLSGAIIAYVLMDAFPAIDPGNNDGIHNNAAIHDANSNIAIESDLSPTAWFMVFLWGLGGGLLLRLYEQATLEVLTAGLGGIGCAYSLHTFALVHGISLDPSLVFFLAFCMSVAGWRFQRKYRQDRTYVKVDGEKHNLPVVHNNPNWLSTLHQEQHQMELQQSMESLINLQNGSSGGGAAAAAAVSSEQIAELTKTMNRFMEIIESRNSEKAD